MRFAMIFETDKENLHRFATPEVIQGWVFDNLTKVNPQVSEWLHNEGIKVGNKVVKPLNFSRLYPLKKVKGYGLKLSSPHPKVMNAWLKVLREPLPLVVPVDGTQVELEVKDYEVVVFSGGERFFTLSPVLIRGRDRCIDPVVFPEQARESVELNLKSKYEALYGKAPEGRVYEFRFENSFTVTVDYKGYAFKARAGTLHLKADEELLKVAYYCGVGYKNACGFGCIEVAEK